MEKYKELIYYTICECLYEELTILRSSTKTSTTFKNLCGGIRLNLTKGSPLSTQQYTTLANTIRKVNLIYGESDGIIGDYVLNFFGDKIWETYQREIMILNGNLKFEKQI